MSAVRGVLLLDLAPFVDAAGWQVARDAWAAVSRSSTSATGRCVRVSLGTARWVDGRVIDALVDYLADAGAVEVVGLEGEAVGAVVDALTVAALVEGAVR